jgi:hypothetical protein
MCSPSWYHQRHGSDFTYDLSVYKSDGEMHHLQCNYPRLIFYDTDEYFDDLSVAYRAEIKDLYEAGCRKFCFASALESGSNITFG